MFDTRTLRPLLTAAALAATAMSACVAQAQPARLANAPPKIAAMAADLETGMWSVNEPGCFPFYFSCYKSQEAYIDGETPKHPLPLKPAPAAEFKKIQDALKEGKSIFDPDSQCYPGGMPTKARSAFKLVFQTNSIVLLYSGAEFRTVYMDGRKIPTEDPALYTFNGTSIGRWDGNTLVVETRNIVGPNTQIPPNVPKSDNFWMIERYTPVSADLIDYSVTMKDEDRWTGPFTQAYQLRRNAKAEPGPQQPCVAGDGQRYAPDADGTLNLTGAGGVALQKAED